MQTVDRRFMLDLSNAGSSARVPVRGVPGWSVVGTDADDWGATVEIEIRKVIGGKAFAYSTPKTITKAAPTSEGIADTQVDELEIVVSVADPTKGHGRIAVFGKETQ